MDDAENGQKNAAPAQQPRNDGWMRFIGYVKRKFHERKAKQEKESSSDRMARRTANATVWIAAFTVVLAVVGSVTLYEIYEGGTDTHMLAVAAKKQADIAWLQAKGTSAAKVDFNASLNNTWLDFSASNTGNITSPAVSMQITVTQWSLPDMKAIGASQFFEIPSQPLVAKGTIYDQNHHVINGFGPDEWEATKRLERTIKVEWDSSYDDGFLQTFKLPHRCWYLLYDSFRVIPGQRGQPSTIEAAGDYVPCTLGDFLAALKKAQVFRQVAEDDLKHYQPQRLN